MIEKDKELKELLQKEIAECDKQLLGIAIDIGKLEAKRDELENRKIVLDKFRDTIYS